MVAVRLSGGQTHSGTRAIAGGEESDAAFLEFEELLSGLLPRLETARVPGANHLLCLKQPRPVAESLARFLARHPLR